MVMRGWRGGGRKASLLYDIVVCWLHAMIFSFHSEAETGVCPGASVGAGVGQK